MNPRLSNAMPPCVLLASGSYGGTLGAIRSLGRRGVPVYVAAHDQDRNVFVSSRYCRGVLPVSMDADWDEIRDDLLRWRASQDLSASPMLIPLSDLGCTIIAAHRPAIERGFVLPMPNNTLITNMQDKFMACTIATAGGLNVPPFGLADNAQSLRQIADRIRYPAIIKPNRWNVKGGVPFKAKTVGGARQLVEEGAALLDGSAVLLVQEYVPGGDAEVSFCMFYRSRDGQTTHLCTGIKRRQLPPGAGIMAYGEALALPSLAERTRQFLEHIGYHGLGGIEYKRYEGRDYFIEMNTRLEAIHPLGVKAGVDFPWLAYCDLVLHQLPRHELPQEPAYWLDEVAGVELLCRYRRAAPVIREMLRLLLSKRTIFAVWSGSDIKPWIRVLLRHGGGLLCKRFRRA